MPSFGFLHFSCECPPDSLAVRWGEVNLSNEVIIYVNPLYSVSAWPAPASPAPACFAPALSARGRSYLASHNGQIRPRHTGRRPICAGDFAGRAGGVRFPYTFSIKLPRKQIDRKSVV